jgi:hypothetical protein
MEKPKRRYTVTLNLGADDMKSVRQTLESILWDLDAVDERDYHSISGSPDAGYSLNIEFSPDSTHETYFGQLAVYQGKDR